MPQPGNPQTLNRFSYVNNNPQRYVDPTGHYILVEEATQEFGPFAVRWADGTLRILMGGSRFRNWREVTSANSYLSGGAIPLPEPHGGAFAAAAIGPAVNAYEELAGIKPDSSNATLLRDVGLVVGASVGATKAMQWGMTEASAFVGSLPWGSTKYYYRYVGEAEASRIQEAAAQGDTVTVQSRRGTTYFSPTRYVSAREAQDFLALPNTPAYRVRIPASYVEAAPVIKAGTVWATSTGYGGGWEIEIAGGVSVPADALRVEPLR